VVGNPRDFHSPLCASRTHTHTFEDAAHGLRSNLKVADDWNEINYCSVEGLEAEIHRLRDCHACALQQASVLEDMGHVQHANHTRNLAHTLAHLDEARPNGFASSNDALILDRMIKDADLRSQNLNGWRRGVDLRLR